MIDIIPKSSSSGIKYNEDLKIIDFKLLKLQHNINTYFVPVYILTDRLPCLDRNFYVTTVRIGFYEHSEFLQVQEQCFSKLEAYHQHKLIYKKLLKGFFDKEIIKIVEREASCKMTFD